MTERTAASGNGGARLALFSIGHSNHPLSQFLALLQKHAIRSLADIRRFPSSRKHPQFNRDALQAALAENQVEYQWIEDLGGRRPKSTGVLPSPNEGLRNASFRNFADYMFTPDFHRGLEELIAMASAQPTAMMCARVSGGSATAGWSATVYSRSAFKSRISFPMGN